jgi:hypothetical protein
MSVGDSMKGNISFRGTFLLSPSHGTLLRGHKLCSDGGDRR